MRVIGAVLAAFALVGCVSTAELMTSAPTESYRTSMGQNDVAFCLADRNLSPVLERDDGSKVVLIKNGFGAVSASFSVYAEPSGSRLEYRRAPGGIGGVWKQCMGQFKKI